MNLYIDISGAAEPTIRPSKATLSDIKEALKEFGMVAVDQSKLMGWYDVLQEALENPQYDHACRARSAVKDMIKASQENTT